MADDSGKLARLQNLVKRSYDLVADSRLLQTQADEICNAAQTSNSQTVLDDLRMRSRIQEMRIEVEHRRQGCALALHARR